MNQIKTINFFWDSLLLVLLICMIRIAVDGSYQEPDPYNTEITQADQAPTVPFTVHQADPEFLEHLDATEKQIDNLLALVDLHPGRIQRLQEIKASLGVIRHDCQTNSLAMAILGPIGTTAIVMKEQKLKTQLKEIIIKIRILLKEHIDSQVALQLQEEQISSLEDNLRINQGYFNQIIS